MRFGLPMLAVTALVVSFAQAQAIEVSFSGYLDARLVAPSDVTGWVKGGLGKFRFGPTGNARLVEAIGQVQATLDDDLSAVVVARMEPTDSAGLDVLEAYVRTRPRTVGALSWSLKGGAFFPTISLENDDLGWTSPYTLTPSAINTWIGEELRSIGMEAVLDWDAGELGTLSAMGAMFCCNDEAGILMAYRGWGLHDRATGLFERIRMPDATMRIFRQAGPYYSGMFDEIDGDLGWYGGLDWRLPDAIGELSIVRYENRADPAAFTARDTAWDTRFWSFGARTRLDSVMLIAQHLAGYTSVVSRGVLQVTKFQSVFLLAATDYEDWRLSVRGDLFQTRRPHVVNSAFAEDGASFTAAVSFNGIENLRLTAEVIVMGNRRREYANDGLPMQLTTSQAQLSARYSLN